MSKGYLYVGMGLVLAILSLSISAEVGIGDETLEHADSNEQHKQNVERMLELMGMPVNVDKAARDVVDLYSAKVDPEIANATTMAIVDAYQTDMEKIIYPTLRWKNLKTTYIYSYAKRMSESEVLEAIRFFDSPAGQKIIATQPDAAKEIKEITKHLVESDLTGPLTQLGITLREGLAKVQKTIKE